MTRKATPRRITLRLTPQLLRDAATRLHSFGPFEAPMSGHFQRMCFAMSAACRSVLRSRGIRSDSKAGEMAVDGVMHAFNLLLYSHGAASADSDSWARTDNTPHESIAQLDAYRQAVRFMLLNFLAEEMEYAQLEARELRRYMFQPSFIFGDKTKMARRTPVK